MIGEFKYVACSRPHCNCPTIDTYETVDGDVMVAIRDDYNGVVVLTPEEMYMIATEYIKAYNEE